MTKRLSIALIAAALFVVLAVLPVSASTVNPDNFNGTAIDAGATVFIGEQGLNLTRALNDADPVSAEHGLWAYRVPTNTTIAWWASGSTSANPDYSVNILSRYAAFTVDQDTFVGRTGNWYVISINGNTVTKKGVVFNVLDPQLSVAVWDWSQNGKDVTGLNVVQGEHLGVKVTTNMYAATYANRNNTIWERAIGPVDDNSLLPDGTVSLWNKNQTGRIGTTNNFTVMELVNGNVYRVVNYTYLARMMYSTSTGPNVAGTFGAQAWCNRTIFWNNTAANSDVDNGQQWTGKNYTSDAAGLTPQSAAWPAAVCMFTPTQKSPTPATDGFISIKVKDEAGAVLTSLKVGTNADNAVLNRTTYQYVDSQPWYFGTANVFWVTDATDNGQYTYPVGTYQVWAESLLNNMKDNYRNAGADFTGKTISATGTVTLVSDSVKIEANKDSVVRSKTFSVTITGKASTQYYVWVKNTNSMTSAYDDQPPYITAGQEKVYFDCNNGAGSVDCSANNAGSHPIGNYQYENGGGGNPSNNVWPNSIWTNVAENTTVLGAINKARYYALINTSTTGTRTVAFTTTNWTKEGKYTIRVEQNMPVTTSGFGQAYGEGTIKSDEVDISVEKGAVTIVAAGDGSYYLGEEIKLSGTNTETYKTYLFLIGPNLDQYGAQINNADPRTAPVTNGDPTTFKVVDVLGDNTWSWKWGTATYALDAGTYTIYAASQPSDKRAEHLANCAYGTVSLIIKKPFVSATASQSTVAKGDRVYITGTAQGDPDQVQIWIMGKNKAEVHQESVNSDSSFSYEIKKETTKDWSSGQYFIVVQHPMQNKVFDVDMGTTVGGVDYSSYVVNKLLISTGGTGSTTIFKLLGANSLQGSDAAEALAEGINDANVDDTYTKLQFLVEEPKITIDPVGDKHVGDKFTITAQTNLAVDDEVLVQIYSSSFKPTQKSQSGEFSGATGTRKVTKGDSGMNKISFDVDTSTFKPDEYIVTEDAVLQDATGTILFNVLETSVTAAPTAVVTTAAPAQPTGQQTAVATTAATPVPTTTKPSPGFGALIALIGLGAVAFVVVRRH